VGKQIRYVISAVEMSTKRVGVIEMSESVAQLIREWAIPNEGARGLIVELGKASKSKHSRLEVNLIRERPPGWVMGLDGLDLVEVLSRTWERIELDAGAKLVGSAG
jgi:hypothetical protein